MLFDVLVTVPSMIMIEIAWCVRFAVILACTMTLFTLVIGAIAPYFRRAEPRLVEKPEHEHPIGACLDRVSSSRSCGPHIAPPLAVS